MKRRLWWLMVACWVLWGFWEVSWASKWGYVGKVGPEHWGDLSPEFFMCKEGRNQSPIDLNKEVILKAHLPPLVFHYSQEITGLIENNGHTIKVTPHEKNYLEVDGQKFYLKQFHFHSPSEHTVNGRYYALEMHLVHQAEDGSLAVVAVFFEKGRSNPQIAQLWKMAPREEGEVKMGSPVCLTCLLPFEGSQAKQYMRYSGSLTTPPCSEGVRWFILEKPLSVSAEQARELQDILGFANNRPVQPINARKVLEAMGKGEIRGH